MRVAMPRNPRLATFAVLWSLGWPAAAAADAPKPPDLPVAAPVVAALATLGPEIADWPVAGEQPPPSAPARPTAAPRGSVGYRDEAVWGITLSRFCATERRVTVDLYTSAPADVTVLVYDDDRALARRRIPRATGERTVTLAPLDLRRGGPYRVEVAAQRPDEPTFKIRRRLVVRPVCE